MLEDQRDLEVMEAEYIVYAEEESKLNAEIGDTKEKVILPPQQHLLQHDNSSCSKVSQETLAQPCSVNELETKVDEVLVKVLKESLVMTKLPAPEPFMFTEEKPGKEQKRLRASALVQNVKPSAKSLTAFEKERGSRPSLSATQDKKQIECVCCQQNHVIYKCEKFAAMPLEEKKRFIINNKMCFGCLRVGHISKSCRKRATCNICRQSHPSPLHEECSQGRKPEASPERASLSLCSVDRDNCTRTSMIVPVWLSCTTKDSPETLVYALLDTQRIGYDCPRALKPTQVISGKDHEPYAVKTDLGWSIVGSITSNNFSRNLPGFCHRIYVKELPAITPASIIRTLEADFQDTDSKEKTISQEDIQFLQQLDERVQHNTEGHVEMPLPFKERPHLPNNK
ncbi:hypothetical protein QQF64_023780 [Cirrhinus molitorella]|uniref:CCHC-type domain-containing protein n=1 Tax=Cirrhinus molitorella TaxID=172907 RepID=A0ABR3NK01_9TELE